MSPCCISLSSLAAVIEIAHSYEGLYRRLDLRRVSWALKMNGSKAGGEKSTCVESNGSRDYQLEANTLLPESVAFSTSHGMALVPADAQRRELGTEDGEGPSRTPRQVGPKRSRSGYTCCYPLSKKVRLEEFVPASQVIDRELRDRYEVKLSSFALRTTFQQVRDVCKGAVQIRVGHHGRLLAWAFARYASEEEAASAANALQGTVLDGARIKVSYCGDKWKDPRHRPRHLLDTLDVQRLPSNCMTAAKVAAIFPTGRVLPVTTTGHAKVKFESTEELISVVRKPEFHVVGGKKLKFAIAVTYCPARQNRMDDGQRAARD
ncbi:hypothetical protein HPB51_006191 [Rhipicephalus microplus]|uniref:RRM domain-containing protein n=1 Tax=Rhipicephalus microplus TaxID=6941 RepID=A0A9J6E788_RHIMP|nr:hypothetical protein HPB51_006191 [Rhipicephalus microplus]